MGQGNMPRPATYTILYLNHVAQTSGAEMSLMEALKELNTARFRPIVACPGSGPLPSRLSSLGIDVRCFPLQRFYRTTSPLTLLSYAIAFVSVLRGLYRVCRRERVCLIHSNSTTSHLYGCLLAAALGIPCVWHVRDIVPLGMLGRILLQFSGAVVAISHAVRRNIVRNPPLRRKISVIYNGINSPQFSNAATPGKVRNELNIPSRVPVVTMIAQMVPWKGHRTFIMALARLPTTVGLIVGTDLFDDHPYLIPSLKSLTRTLGIKERVKFLGQRGDVPDVIADSNVVVIPSNAEPLGRVALEAMALGKPVVGTDAGGLPEVVQHEHTGLLVRPRNPDLLAAAIERLINNPELASRMGNAGKTRVVEQFDVHDQVAQIESLYEKLIAGKRSCV